MNGSLLVWVLLLLVLAGGLLAFSIHLRRRAPTLPGAAVQPSAAPDDALAAPPGEPVEPAIPVEFRLSSAHGAPPVLTATALDADDFHFARSNHAQPFDTRCGGINRLAPILRSVLCTSEAAERALPRYLKVRVNGALANRADGQSLQAFMLDVHGRSIEYTRLNDPVRLRFGYSGALLFQAVSVIVAQKHLKELHAQLANVALVVDRIQHFPDYERRHELLTGIDAMARRVPELEAGLLDPAWQQQLGGNDQSLARIQEQLRQEIQSALSTLGAFTTGWWKATSKRQSHIDHALRDFEQGLWQWQLTTEARILGWNLLVAGPGALELKCELRQAIAHEIDLVLADGGLVAQFDQGVRQQIAQIQALVRKADARRRRDVLLERQDVRLRAWRVQQADMARRMEAAMAIEQTRDHTLSLALRLEGDDIVEAYELLPAIESGGAPPEPSTSIDAAPLHADMEEGLPAQECDQADPEVPQDPEPGRPADAPSESAESVPDQDGPSSVDAKVPAAGERPG